MAEDDTHKRDGVDEAAWVETPEEERLTLGDVLQALQRAMAFLGEVPWVGLGVLSTGLGGALMYAYFRSVAYSPSDVGALLGVGAAVAAMMFVYLVFATAVLAAPHWVYAFTDTLKGVPWRRLPGRLSGWNNFLAGAQVLGVGLFFGYMTWNLWRDCVDGLIYVFAPALVFMAVGGLLVLHASWRKTSISVIGVGAFALLLFFALLPATFLYGWVAQGPAVSEWKAALWLVAWLAMVCFLATLPDRVPAWALFLVVPTLLPMILWVLPALFGNSTTFPRHVMEMAGVRSAKVVELRVTPTTCELVASAAGWARSQCPADAAFAEVRAQVLSNLGSRWWIEVQQVGDLKVEAGTTLRLTVPADSVQVVYRQPSGGKKSNRCKT